MRRLLKIIDNLARLIAVIDTGKQICEHLASKKQPTTQKKETQPTDFSAIAPLLSDSYRPFFYSLLQKLTQQQVISQTFTTQLMCKIL